MAVSQALANVPAGLRDPLFGEYSKIVQNYMERRWSAAELSGGHFCEIVFTILDGHAKGAFEPAPIKPRDFVSACRALESNTHVPRSFQILIPRLLPALYEIRNNRGVGHVGGDVDPNHMDANAVLAMSNWTLAELVRVFHALRIDEAQRIVDSIAERRIPLVWDDGKIKRVLNPELGLKEHVLVLLASVSGKIEREKLQAWCDYQDNSYFLKTLRKMHKDRMLEFSEPSDLVEILPPGSKLAEEIVRKEIN